LEDGYIVSQHLGGVEGLVGSFGWLVVQWTNPAHGMLGDGLPVSLADLSICRNVKEESL